MARIAGRPPKRRPIAQIFAASDSEEHPHAVCCYCGLVVEQRRESQAEDWARFVRHMDETPEIAVRHQMYSSGAGNRKRTRRRPADGGRA